MKKMFRKILAAAITATMTLSVLPTFASASDDSYIYIENIQGIWGGAPNAIGKNSEAAFELKSDGFGSKPAGDTFAAITSPVNTKIHLYNANDITWDNVNKTRILNVEMDFVPVVGIKEVRLWQTNSPLSQILDLSGANKNDWNHLKYEIDLSAGRMAVELNGEKVRNIRLAAAFDWTKMPQMRIQFESDGVGNADGNMILYSDNIKIYTTDTADQVFLNDSFTYNTANNQYYTINAVDKLSYVTGTGGKAVDDRALDIVTNNKNDTYLGIYIPVTSKYVKVQYNIMPKTNFNTLTNQARNTPLHYEMIKVSEGKTLVSNQWNKVELLLENKTGYNSSTMEIVFGTKLYINGSLVSDVEKGKNSASKESAESDTFPLRIRIGGADAAAATEFVLDDLKIMTSTTPFTKDDSVSLTGKDAAITEPAVYPKTPLSNGTVSAYNTTKVSDFSANGAAVRAFTDNTYNGELTETDVIEVGNVIVTEDSNHQIKYYDVTELVPNPGFEPIDVSINYDDRGYGVIGTATKGTSSLVSGKAGKADTDYSMKIDKNTASGAIDVYLEYQAVPSEAEFITVEYNILPDRYLAKCYLGTRYSNGFGNVINANALNIGRWNNIKYIFTNPDTTKTNVGDACNMKADIYINRK
ncbi:MAG: hypothetical protein SOZ34_10060, partial [Clostridia bacterium]|nr:hypothetical protein [Clostridia bacterium]